MTAASSGSSNDYQHLLRDNYENPETPYFTPELAGNEFELEQLEMILKLSVDEFKSHAQALSSPDELSVYIARQLMRQVAPTLLWITLHDQHHRTGDTLSRTTWMLVAGPGVRQGVVFDRAVDSTDLVPTLGAKLGFNPAFAQGKPISELL